MIRTVAKLVVAFAILHAAARAGWTAWKYYELKDAAREVILFGADAQADRLADRIFEKAVELEVPLERQDIEVRRDGDDTFADASYTANLPLLPGLIYPVELSFSVEAMLAPPATLR